MNRPEEIHHSGRTIGGILFEPNQFIGGLNRNQTSVEFILTPSLSLEPTEDKTHYPCFWNISGRIYGKSETSPSPIFLGDLSSRDFYSAPMRNGHCEINWRTSVQELLEFEDYRNGKSPVFKIDLYGLTCLARKVAIGEREEQFQTQSYRYFHTFEVKVPIETWQNQMQTLGLRRYCLFELRVDNLDEGLKEVNASIQQAINYFYTGGSIGWRDTVGAVRLALEKLDKKFPNIFRTPANKPPSDLDKWTKLERIYNLIWSVKHLTHIPHHNDEETWNRDEALLVLNNLIIISHLIQKYNTKP